MESLLQIDNLVKSFGDLVLFDGFTVSIGDGEKVGLIARNGQGKSTLLSIINGTEDYNSGTIIFRRDIKISYLVQSPSFPKGTKVINACFGGDSPVLKALSEYELALTSGDHDRLQNAMNVIDSLDAWSYESKAKQILSQLNINDFNAVTDNMSGGEIKKIALAGALISDPDFLILDEPTNHLDTEVTQWLEDYLSANRLTLLLVTHDRYLLDRVCNRIVEIDDCKAYSYSGNYQYYLNKRQERISAESSQRESDLNLYRTELDWMRRMPCARGTKARYRKDSFYELEERLKHRRQEQNVNLDVKASYIGKKIFELEHLRKAFGDKKIINDFSYIFTRYEKVGIIGKNGVGKSTFLKILLDQELPDSGKVDRGTTLNIGYYSQQGMEFNPDDRVIDAAKSVAEWIELDDGRKMSVSQFLQKFLFPPKTQYQYIYKLSGGEKRRLNLCMILMKSPNFLILDEPTNDLDIMTLQVLEEYLAAFKGCLIVVSHDRYFMDKVAQHLFVFEGDGVISDFPSSYSDWLQWKDWQDEIERENREKAAKPAAQAQPKYNERPAQNKLTFKEKREMEQIEAEMEKLESERKALEEELNSGTLPFDQLSAKSARIGEIIARNDEITMRWLELSEKE